MRAIGIVETDRQAGPAAHRAINEQVARVMEHGWSLIIYPEGTRSRDGELKPFKKGAFRIAVDNGLPVVPITLAGTREAWVPGQKFVRGGPVRMVVGEPIPTEGLGAEAIGAVRDSAHAAIAETYDRIRFDHTRPT
jgi:1-acyl-sn-glycerol-3-phosphate acyltransferase